MIERFVKYWEARKVDIRAHFASNWPEDYEAIVKTVIEHMRPSGEDGPYFREDCPDPDRIHEIDDGDYQGTLIYVIANTGYQPSTYWAVDVGYGSCSGCDALQAITDYRDEHSESDLDQLMQLALNVVQGLRQIAGYGDFEGMPA